MIGFGGLFPVVRKKLVNVGALLGALVYASLSLHLSDLKPMRVRQIHSGSAAPDSGAAPSTIQAEAIAAPGSSAPGGEGHKCCCRHGEAKCEMGCCGARAEVSPNESCYQACAGANAPGSETPFRMATHLASRAIRFFPRLAADPASRSTVQWPHAFPSKPPEKVPIA